VTAMSKCRDLEPLLAAYVDGEAAADECASVDAHVERCPPCRERLAGYKKPRIVEFAAELPKNAYGKVERRRLRGARGGT